MVIDTTPVAGSLSNSSLIELQQVRRTGDESLFNSLDGAASLLEIRTTGRGTRQVSGLGAGPPDRVLMWSSAYRHLGSRDRYIGLNAEARRRNIRFIAYNTFVFSFCPGGQVPHLASHLLGRMAATFSDDWQRMYSQPIYFAETFIDPSRFRGTCYRAANWQLLGLTTASAVRTIRLISPIARSRKSSAFVLTPRFREYLSQV